MSAATKAALDAAIAAHVADECEGDMASGWVVVAETTNVAELESERSSFFIATRDLQSLYLTDGLLTNALLRNSNHRCEEE